MVVIVVAIVYKLFYINIIMVDDVVALGDESRHTLILLEQLGKLWFSTIETGLEHFEGGLSPQRPIVILYNTLMIA